MSTVTLGHELVGTGSRGFGADAAWLRSAQADARDVTRRADMVKERFASRLSPGWGAYKCRRWLATSEPEASAHYIAMFARDGLPTPEATISVPVLAITGEEDVPPMRKEAVLSNLSPLCPELETLALLQCGHYPMQEMPPLTVSLVERFCGA